MGGYCTFAYRNEAGNIKSGLVYTGYLKLMMLSYARFGRDVIDHVLDEPPEGYGAEALQAYRDRTDKRPVMVYYGMVFVDAQSNQILSFQGYTSPTYEAVMGISHALKVRKTPLSNEYYYTQKDIEIMRDLADRGRIQRVTWDKVKEDEVLTPVTSWEDLLKDVAEYDRIQDLKADDIVAFFEQRKNYELVTYRIDPLTPFKKYENARKMYDDLLALGIELPDYEEFIKGCSAAQDEEEDSED